MPKIVLSQFIHSSTSNAKNIIDWMEKSILSVELIPGMCFELSVSLPENKEEVEDQVNKGMLDDYLNTGDGSDKK